MLGPRYSDPANRESGFSVAVGSALQGFSGAQDYMRKKKLEQQSDEDRQRAIDEKAQADAVRDYEAGVSTNPAAPNATPAPAAAPAQPTPPANDQFSQGVPFGNAAPAAPAASAPAPSSLASAVGAQLASAGTTAPQASQPPAIQQSVSAPVTPPQQPQGGIRSRVGQVLGRIAGNITGGGFTPTPTPHYTATRTGPSAKERVEGVQQSGENAREHERAGTQRDIATGNNATSIRVAEIAADSREQVARAKAQNDQRMKLSMQAVASQIGETDKSIAQFEKEYDKAEPGIADNSAARAEKKAHQQRIQLQIDRLRGQRQNLATQQQTMMLGMAMGVSDFAGLLPQPTPVADPNDETQLDDAHLWEKKRADGMTPEQATTYVRSRKKGP